jgi:hypothetical protein
MAAGCQIGKVTDDRNPPNVLNVCYESYSGPRASTWISISISIFLQSK